MENVTKEICQLVHKDLNKTIDKLCHNIDKSVQVAIQTSKEVYLLCSKVKERDNLNEKVDDLVKVTTKNTTMWKIFSIMVGLIAAGSLIVSVFIVLI